MKPAIVVTGAASGIGRAFAQVAARDGSAMILIDRSRDALESLAVEQKSRGVEAYALPIDLADPNAGATIQNALSERGLYCDVVVNNAGLSLFGPAAELDRAEQMTLLDVNIRALTELTLRFIPGMIERGRGGVLNVGSVASYMSMPYAAVYNAAKSFVRSFSAALATEVSGTGVTVTCLCPGMVRTPLLERLPVTHTRAFKIIPRSNASDTAASGWRGFRAGKRLVIPRLVDRIIVALLTILPARVMQKAVIRAFQDLAVKRPTAPAQNSLKPAVVVTGASSGIGRELARVAARDGSAMMLVARSHDALASLAAELESHGVQAHALSVDLTDRNAGAMIQNALSERGLYCDVIVNNAGICLAGPAYELDRAEQITLIDVNIRALTDLTLQFIPGMIERGRGGVLNVGSLGAYMSAPNLAAYHASKAYVGSFSAALAAEVASSGVTVTCLSPGVVRTPLVDRLPIPRTFMVKLAPRSNASDTALAGWRGFGAGKRLVIPRLADRLIAAALFILPHRAIPRVPIKPRAGAVAAPQK